MRSIFTDGSSIANGKPNCVSGCGVYFKEKELSFSFSCKKAAEYCNIPLSIESNNVGELMGILLALTVEKENLEEPVVIYSDSMYCINSVTNWWKNWEKNDWKTSNGTIVKNKEIIQRIIKEIKNFKDLSFKHVRGHKKEPQDRESLEFFAWDGNNKADRLAFFSIRENLNIETNIKAIVE